MFCLRCGLIVLFVSNVMSSAYCRIIVFVFCGLGISFVYKMNNVGESAVPCGTPAYDWKVLEMF